MPFRDLASDNYAPIHPAVLEAIGRVNAGHESSYGADSTTAALRGMLEASLGQSLQVLPVLTGTGANVLGVTAITPRWGAVVTSSHGHMIGDEGGAPIRLSGIPLLPVASPDGKLTVDMLEAIDWHDGFVHSPQATTLSIAETTELGTVYTPEELRALTSWAHERGMLVHLDGARIFNAMAACSASLAELTVGAGVDVFSIGATKIGALAAEAIVVVNEQVQGAEFVQKYLMQMPSKARYVSAQVLAFLEDDLGLALGEHSNAMATLLAAELASRSHEGVIPEVEYTQVVESNQLFLRLPAAVAERMREQVHFYDWDTPTGEVRWVTSWDTTEEDIAAAVDALVAAYRG